MRSVPLTSCVLAISLGLGCSSKQSSEPAAGAASEPAPAADAPAADAPAAGAPASPAADEVDIETLHARMRAIGAAVGALHDELQRKTSEIRSSIVSEQLQTIHDNATSLTGKKVGSHPLFSVDLMGFIQEVEGAQAKVAESPSSYASAARISQACVSCHEMRPCKEREGLCPDVPGL